jgi:hypothetical protein
MDMLWPIDALSEGLNWVDITLCRTSLYRLPRALILDTILGRFQGIELLGQTTPANS